MRARRARRPVRRLAGVLRDARIPSRTATRDSKRHQVRAMASRGIACLRPRIAIHGAAPRHFTAMQQI
jgi:hypothetical protein